MSGRFVRASSYRHVHGVEAKPNDSFTDIRPSTNGDGDHITACTDYIAYASQGGGGPVVVTPISRVGRQTKVYKIGVHKGKVFDQKFSPFNNSLLATASEDCLAMVTKLPDEIPEDGFLKDPIVKLQGHQKKVHLLQWHPTANNILATSSFDNTVKFWDVEAQAEVLSFDDHKDAPQDLSWNTNGSLMMTHCKDKKLRIFDPRQSGSAQECDGFEGAKKASVHFVEQHGLLVGVGFNRSSSRHFMVWDPKKLDKAVGTVDIDQSAGIFMTHYDPDTSVLYCAGKGDSSIAYFEVVSEAPYVHFLSKFGSSKPQKGAAWLPKTACDTTTCEIARCMRLMRDMIVPISFQVPRKSDMFQADIFPDTYAGMKAMEAADYLAGKNADPVMTSMKPGEGTERVQETFSAKKSPAELQAELDAAHARIKELEAEIAKLKA